MERNLTLDVEGVTQLAGGVFPCFPFQKGMADWPLETAGIDGRRRRNLRMAILQDPERRMPLVVSAAVDFTTKPR